MRLELLPLISIRLAPGPVMLRLRLIAISPEVRVIVAGRCKEKVMVSALLASAARNVPVPLSAVTLQEPGTLEVQGCVGSLCGSEMWSRSSLR